MEANKNGSLKAAATYSVESWKEEDWQTISPEMKMTKASVVFAFKEGIEGKVMEEYLMYYESFDSKDPHKSSAEYIGMLRFEGKLGGKSGTFAADDSGFFEGGAAFSTLRILEGSGTGELKGIKGTGKYRADQKGSHFELEYELG